MATLSELAKAALRAEARATHYASEAKRLYTALMKKGATLTKAQAAQYYDAIERNRTSAQAAADHLAELLKEIARTRTASTKRKVAKPKS